MLLQVGGTNIIIITMEAIIFIQGETLSWAASGNREGSERDSEHDERVGVGGGEDDGYVGLALQLLLDPALEDRKVSPLMMMMKTHRQEE